MFGSKGDGVFDPDYVVRVIGLYKISWIFCVKNSNNFRDNLNMLVHQVVQVR